MVFNNIAVKSDNKTAPYRGYIDSIINEINFDFTKTSELKLYPLEMMDDRNLFGNGDFVGVNTTYSNQPNETVFKIDKGYDIFNLNFNRSVTTDDDYLSLFKIKFNLSSSMTVIFRSYPKFTEVLAGVSSMLSTGLIVLSIFMNNYNSIQGKNNMVKSLYTNEGLQNIKNFSVDLNETMKELLTNKNVFLIKI